MTGGRIVLGALLVGLGAVALRRDGSGLFGTNVRGDDEVEGEPVQRVAGTAWRFEVPPGRWYTSRRRFPCFDDPQAIVEKVLVRPDGHAVACLIWKKAPANGGFDVDALANEISTAWANRFPPYKLHEIAPLPARGTRVLHVSARIDNRDFEALWGLYANPPRVYAFMAGAPPHDFPGLRAELEGLLASFQSDALPPDPAPTLTYIQKSFSDIRDLGSRPRSGRPDP